MHIHNSSPQRSCFLVQPFEHSVAYMAINLDAQKVNEVREFPELRASHLKKVATYRQSEAYLKAMRKRSLWVEPLFGEAKKFHGLRRFRLRHLRKVNIEGVMVAAGQNLKRLIQHHLAKLFLFSNSLLCV